MFSVSLLYSSHDFLNLVSKVGMTQHEFKNYFKTYKYSEAQNILDICFKSGWTKITQNGQIELSPRGQEIANLGYKQGLLLQLEDLILILNPPWGALLSKGRTEAKNFLPHDALQCFKECGLFEPLNQEIISFWDKLAIAYRNYTQKRLTEIGRQGEKLSFEYEWQRTGKEPIWQSIESNLSGFDILSISDSNTISKLQIEVKATTSSINYAKIHVTKNEWLTAINSLNYIFHLWLINETNQVFLVPVDNVRKHIPFNNGSGEWETVEIPFKKLIDCP